MKFAINGLGRIGRTLFRSVYKLGLTPAAVNDLGPIDNLAYLLKYDSAYGKFEADVEIKNGNLMVDGKEIKVFCEPDPKKLSWGREEIDLVIESTGKFVEYDLAYGHINAGAKMVLISAPYKGEKQMPTIIYGINHQDLKIDDKVVSMASCTTNCLLPVAKILEDEFGIKKAMMNTMHSFTMDQMLQDAPHKDFRRGRNALQSIIPTSSGATIAASRIIPGLKNKMDGYSFRVPTPIVSVLDFVAVMKKEVKVQELQEKFKQYATDDKFMGGLEVTDEPLVSIDFKASPAASIVDLNLIQVVDGDLARIVAYYDNEMGYSARMASLIKYIGEQIYS